MRIELIKHQGKLNLSLFQFSAVLLFVLSFLIFVISFAVRNLAAEVDGRLPVCARPFLMVTQGH